MSVSKLSAIPPAARPQPVLLPHRFAPAPGHNFTIARDRLLRALNEASLCKQLTIVHGAAGAGKTTLLGQWAARLKAAGRTPLWITLEPSDGEAAGFVEALTGACGMAGEHDLASELLALDRSVGAMSPDAVARIVGSALNRRGAPLLLLLDSYEQVDSMGLGQIVSGLAHHCPNLRVTLATRRRPTLPLGALRSRNQIFDVPAARLHFTADETAAVMDGLLPELYAHYLHARTGGLPVAVQFARRALDEGRTPGDPCQWEEWLCEYFRSEILDGLDPALKDIVGRLAIVDRFDLSLAQALAGSLAGSSMEQLHRVEAILHQEAYGEFRFPEMLRGFLAERLTSHDAALRRELHSAAADWFAQRGLDHEALHHAIASSDSGRALDLLARVGGTSVVMQRGVVGAREALEAMAMEMRETQPMSHLSFALILAHDGRIREATEVVDATRADFDRHDVGRDTPERRQLQLTDSFIAGLRDEPYNPERLADVEAMIEEFGPSAHDQRAQAHTICSWQHYLSGDLAKACAKLDDAADEYAGSEGIYGSIFLHVHRTLIAFWDNDLDGALAESSLAGRLASLFFPEDQRLRVTTDVLRGSLLFEVGEFQPDVQFVELVGLAAGLEGWIEIQLWAHRFAARHAMALGRGTEARAICANARDVAERLDAPRLDWSLRCLGLSFEARHGCPRTARREAEAIGLIDGTYLDRPDFGWQERIGGSLTAITLWHRLGEARRRDDAFRAAENLLGQTPIPRFQAMLHLARAQFAEAQDPAAVQRHISAARACFPGSSSVPLMMDVQPELRFPNATAASAGSPARQPESADDPLTLRERQILEYIGEGHPSKVAAYRFGLSEATIKFHLRNVYRKLRAQNRTQALARYRALGLSTP